jgi:hypothetical protein
MVEHGAEKVAGCFFTQVHHVSLDSFHGHLTR